MIVLTDRARLAEVVQFPGIRGEPGPVWKGPGYSARPVSLDALPGFRVGAAWFSPDQSSSDAVIVAHGHFG